MTPEDFFSLVRSYCARTSASVTSYGRTPLHNAAVGGVEWGAHPAWLAADVVYDVAQPELDRRRIAEQLGLRLVVEGDHDHVQPWDWKKP